jgi:hypothetical protein
VNGSLLLPVTINGYGGSCGVSRPQIENIDIAASSYITVDSVDFVTTGTGKSMNVQNSNNILLTSNTATNPTGICLDVQNSSGVTNELSTFSNCEYGVNIGASEVQVNNNTLTNITEDAITVSSNLPVTLGQNAISSVGQNGIIYGQNTTVSQNGLTNICTTSSPNCSAIKNDPSLLGAIVTSTVSQNIINGVGSGLSADRNYGIRVDYVQGTNVTANTVINASRALSIVDANTLNIGNNTLLTPRIQAVTVLQNTGGLVHTNIFTGNTILQKNPDYTHIEMIDAVSGSNGANGFLSPNANTMIPTYKPNIGSFVRAVNFGGATHEYSKTNLSAFDANISTFTAFAYAPYVNTGSFATANLLANPNFDSDAASWTASAELGLAPTLSHNPAGTHSGGSLDVTPTGGAADRMWITNDTEMNITSGQTFLVTGYARSSSGNVNIRGFLHQSGSMNTLYSDRIADTYATASGGLFSFYVSATATAADAVLTFEVSNQNVTYELDTLSIRRMNAVIKNNTANEVLVFTNTGSSPYDQSCP